jgi:hypothetical protein
MQCKGDKYEDDAYIGSDDNRKQQWRLDIPKRMRAQPKAEAAVVTAPQIRTAATAKLSSSHAECNKFTVSRSDL